MGPVAASATIVNLLLATGPFTYPQGFVLLGPVTSTILMLICCFMAYVTSLFMVEAISVAAAIGDNTILPDADKRERSESLFQKDQYKSPMVERKVFLEDLNTKQSAFYIREKIEIAIIARRIGPFWA